MIKVQNSKPIEFENATLDEIRQLMQLSKILDYEITQTGAPNVSYTYDSERAYQLPDQIPPIQSFNDLIFPNLGIAPLYQLDGDQHLENWYHTTLSGLLSKMRIPENANYFLDFKTLQMGDLILKRPKKPDTIQSGIQIGQQYEYPKEMGDHHLFTHAMISRGADEVYESELKPGVHRDTFWSSMNGDNEFKVLRLPNKDLQNRTQVVLNAAELTGNQYDFIGSLFASIKSARKLFPYRERNNKKDYKFFCSALYAAACDYEGINLKLGYDDENQIDPQNPRFVTPAALSACKSLEEVNIPLLKIDDFINR